MDYSAVANEASPWGSSSPQASRAGFPDTSDPDSPNSIRHSYTQSRDSFSGSPVLTSTEDEVKDSPHDRQGSAEADQQGLVDRSKESRAEAAGADSYGQHQAQQQQSYGGHLDGQRPSAARYHGARQQKSVPQYKLQTKVTALERSGRKDPVLRFDVYTNLPKFRTTQFRDVRRTHSEFVKLKEHLISSNPEAIVPAVPPALTSAGAGTEEDESRVKNSIQRWLNYVCGNDVLMRDEEMIFFVESDFGYSPVVRMKQPATGVRRKVLKQFAPPPDDTPELHLARPVVKAFYLATLDAAQKMDKLVKARRGLGLAESSLGEKLGTMHVQETHAGLGNAYKKMGRTIQTVGDYHAAQGTAEATTLGDPLDYHAADAFIVKETLTNRHILLRELLQAEQVKRSKENAVTRLKSSTSVRREKVDEAISALDEAASQENYLKGKTQRVTSNLLVEKRRWFDRTTTDLMMSIREYAIRQIDAERRLLSTLESVRPDVRAIDASGGLSRLGREHNPNARKVNTASSQTAKGDAWSGVPRSHSTLSRSVSGAFPSAIPELEEGSPNGNAASNRPRSSTGTASLGSNKDGDEDDDRVDARNAASRLAQSTF